MLKASNEDVSAGGPAYEASERTFGGETSNRPRLVIQYDEPSVQLHTPTKINPTGAELSWGDYVDPSPADDANGQPIYVGVTNDVARRQAQHGTRFTLDPVTSTPLTRGQARAIEQAWMDRYPFYVNRRNSISPEQPYYNQAVAWGEAWLRANGLW